MVIITTLLGPRSTHLRREEGEEGEEGEEEEERQGGEGGPGQDNPCGCLCGPGGLGASCGGHDGSSSRCRVASASGGLTDQQRGRVGWFRGERTAVGRPLTGARK